MTAAGGNSTISFAYYYTGLDMSLSIGYRYQYLRFKQDYNQVVQFPYDGKTDKFYGVTFSAVYSFGI